MSVTPLPLSGPRRFERPRTVRSSDLLLALISELVAARQSLRASGADGDLLDRNRAQIAQAQWELSYAFVDRYCGHAAAA